MSGHIAGQPIQCYGIPIDFQKEPLLDERGIQQRDEAGKPRYLCGFRIAGGIDQDNLKSPQGYPDKGIYVTHVNSGSPAEKAGLRIHDKILQVNGHDLTMATHKKAVDYFTRREVLKMLVSRPEENGDRRTARGSRIDNTFERRDKRNNLENEMNKMNVDPNAQFGNFRGDLNYERSGVPGQQPQPMPRIHDPREPTSRTGPHVDENYNVQRGKQLEREQYRGQGSYQPQQQQNHSQPRREGPFQNWESNPNSNFPGGPLKPPRWQQYTQPDQQITGNSQRIAATSQSFQYPPRDRSHNYGGRGQNQSSALDNHMSGNPSDYRQQDVNQGGYPVHSSAAYHDQRYGPAADARNQNGQMPYMQQRAYAGEEQRFAGHSTEKRSTLPSNATYQERNKFY